MNIIKKVFVLVGVFFALSVVAVAIARLAHSGTVIGDLPDQRTHWRLLMGSRSVATGEVQSPPIEVNHVDYPKDLCTKLAQTLADLFDVTSADGKWRLTFGCRPLEKQDI